MRIKCRPKSRRFVTVSQMPKTKTTVKQHVLEAQTHRSRARALSDQKSNRNRPPWISPNITPADVPAQSEWYPATDSGALKNYQTRDGYD